MWETFRIEKSDLKIKPGYQKVKERIESMNNISFVSYALYIELERILHKRAPEISMTKAIKQISGIKESSPTAPNGLPQNQHIKTNEIWRKILECVKY
jgi:transposase